MNYINTKLPFDNIIGINNKPIKTPIEHENALHNAHKIRNIRDQATDSMVHAFFKHIIIPQNDEERNLNIIKERARNLFLLYVYDTFKYNILAYFNQYLMEQNIEIIDTNNDEYIDFVFKGGNIMFMNVFNKMNTDIRFRNIVTNTPNLRTFIDESFAISDFDFSVYLKTTNNKKFEIVKKHLTLFLLHKLESINSFFNQYLSDILQTNNNYFNNSIKDNNLHSTIHGNVGNQIPANIINPNLNGITANNLNDVNYVNRDLILNKLNYINGKIAKLYNSQLFDSFINKIKSSEPSDIFINRSMMQNNVISMNFVRKYSKILTSFNERQIAPIVIRMITAINSINDQLDILNQNHIPINNNNKKVYANIINTLSQLQFLNKKYNLKIFVIGINLERFLTISINRFNEYFSNLQNLFKYTHFYHPYKIHNFIKKLATNLYSKSKLDINNILPVARKWMHAPDNESIILFNSNKSYLDESNYEVVKITNDTAINVQDNSLTITGTNNIAVIDDYKTPFSIYSSEKINNFHYISYNSSIYVNKNNGKTVVNFDLLRTKLNIAYDGAFTKKIGSDVGLHPNMKDRPNLYKRTKLNIPSEFIDISISCSNDTGGEHYVVNKASRKGKYYVTLSNDIPYHFSVEGYNKEYIVYDLQSVLLRENPYIPWNDNKYAKRFRRLFFIYAMISDENYFFIYRIQKLTYHMINYLNNNDNNSLIFIRNNLYDNSIRIKDTFLQACEILVKNNDNIMKFRFGNVSYYNRYMDEIVNGLFYLFLIHISYDRVNVNHPDNIRINNINNYCRKKYNYHKYDINQLNNNYIQYIIPYIQNINDISNKIIAFLFF